MKYTLEQRLDIGRRIYEGELTRFQAAEEYGINDNTARNYMWLYRDTNHLPPKNVGRKRTTYVSKTPQTIEATTNLNKWPIPRIENDDAKKIAKYVEGIMNCNIEIQEAESKINDIVFKAFNLSENEIVQINKCTGKEAA